MSYIRTIGRQRKPTLSTEVTMTFGRCTPDKVRGNAVAGAVAAQMTPAITAILTSKLRMAYPLAEEVGHRHYNCRKRDWLREIKA